MKRRKNPKPDDSPIGDRLLTLRETAEVLHLSTHDAKQGRRSDGRFLGFWGRGNCEEMPCQPRVGLCGNLNDKAIVEK